MTANAHDWKHKKSSAFIQTSRSECSSPLLVSDVDNATYEFGEEGAKSLGLSTRRKTSLKRKHISKEQCARTHKKVAASININKKRCPLMGSVVTSTANGPINENFVSTATSGVLDNLSRPIKRRHTSKELCAAKAFFPETKSPPKLASYWGSTFFYRSKTEPKCTTQNSVWESQYHFRPKDKDEQMCKETLRNNKKQAVDFGHKALAHRKARSANNNGYNLVRDTDPKIFKAETLKKGPAKLGRFDDLDELPDVFKGTNWE